MKVNEHIQSLRRWVVRHRNFAIALPIILVLTGFFIIENIKGFQTWSKGTANTSEGFNTELPGSVPALKTDKTRDAGQPMDSLDTKDREVTETMPELTGAQQSENDSLQGILRHLEGLSMKSNPSEMMPTEFRDNKTKTVSQAGQRMTEEERKQRYVENRLAYREMLLEGKRKSIGDDGTPIPNDRDTSESEEKRSAFFRATIYGDHFILPNENVRLLLMEEMVQNGKKFPKNTFIYALASVRQNRVYLDIDNIGHHPVAVSVRDFNDGREGIYNERAGELWREYKAETGGDILEATTNDITEGAPNLLKGIAQGLGAFLRKKRLKEKEKIFLMDDYELLLVTQ